MNATTGGATTRARSSDQLKRVFLITPYAGDVESNVAYLWRCMIDCFAHGEAPFAPHGLYPGPLDDRDPKDRALGIRAGRAWLAASEAAVCYIDRGISIGMVGDLRAVLETVSRPMYCDEMQPLSLEFRRLGAAAPSDAWLHEHKVPHRTCPVCQMEKTAAAT